MTMTVKELIKKLSKMPMDATIIKIDSSDGEALFRDEYDGSTVWGDVDEWIISPVQYTVNKNCGEKIPDGTVVVAI